VIPGLAAAACSPSAQTPNRQLPSRPPVQHKPPTAPVETVRESLHGQVVVDHHRWMEQPDGRLDRWLTEQARHTTAILHALPDRAEIRSLVTRHSTPVARMTDLEWTPTGIYFRALAPGGSTWSLFLANGVEDPALLFDPARHLGSSSATLDYAKPSPDGRLVAVGVSTSGSEDSQLRIFDTATDEMLPESIPHTQYAKPSWTPDGKSFFYWKLTAEQAQRPGTARFKDARVYRHVIGTDPAIDKPVFGNGIAGVRIHEDTFPFVSIRPHAPQWAIASGALGTQREYALFVTRTEDLIHGRPIWRPITDLSDKILDFDVAGDQLYLLSSANTVNGEVLSVDLSDDRPRPVPLRLAAAEGRPLVELRATRGGVYLRTVNAGISRLLRADADGSNLREVPLPPGASVRAFSTSPHDPGALLEVSSWTEQLTHHKLSVHEWKLARLRLFPDTSSAANVHVEHARAKSADGTSIPLTIFRKSKSRGPAPTILTAYGAYGLSMQPSYLAARLAWLDKGGILAIAHVRGGGEFGEAWHHAARRAKKQISVDDYLACARHLIDHGYTTPTLLAGNGRSAGGIIVGAALMQSPQLFAAAAIEYAPVNLLRFEHTIGGPANVFEFGTASNRSEFATLARIDAYNQVADGKRYPPMLLTTSRNDLRVPAWQLAKFAARLQQAHPDNVALLRVEPEGGHGFAAARAAQIDESSDIYAFLWHHLGALRAQAEPPPVP
jgi:prolyl oligopeptidase